MNRVKLFRIAGTEVKDEDIVTPFGQIQYALMATQPVLVTIYKVTDEAADVWPGFDEGATLW